MLQVTTGNKVFTFSEISGGKILFLAWQQPCSPLSQLNDCKNDTEQISLHLSPGKN